MNEELPVYRMTVYSTPLVPIWAWVLLGLAGLALATGKR